jgi:hypothetical protein
MASTACWQTCTGTPCFAADGRTEKEDFQFYATLGGDLADALSQLCAGDSSVFMDVVDVNDKLFHE